MEQLTRRLKRSLMFGYQKAEFKRNPGCDGERKPGSVALGT